MKAKGLFMFKSVETREKGSFTNKQTGEVIEFDSCYILVADEITLEGKMKERRFKISKEDTKLINELSLLEPYTKIEIEFDVILYSSNAKIEPVAFEVV